MKDKTEVINNLVSSSKLAANYMHVEPNSHFYTEFEHIKHSLELGLSREYIITGLENTINNGYKITKEPVI